MHFEWRTVRTLLTPPAFHTTSNYACRSIDEKILRTLKYRLVSMRRKPWRQIFRLGSMERRFLRACRRVSAIQAAERNADRFIYWAHAKIASGTRQVAGCDSTTNLQSSAGVVMSVWDRWVPHCASVCMYEIARQGFVVQPREGDSADLF